MIQEKLKTDPTWLRLKKLVESRFGKKMTITTIADVSNLNPRQDLHEVHNNNIHVPILNNGDHLGTAIVHNARSLQLHDQVVLAEMIRMILAPTIGVYAAELQTPFNPEVSNPTFQVSPECSLYLLESKNPVTIQRVALQIHSVLGGWSYLRYEEIFQQINSAEDLKELGPMTILIPELSTLSQFEQSLLAEFAQTARRDRDPFILIGCTQGLQKAKELRPLNQNLTSILQGHRLNVDGLPLAFSVLREALELVFDRTSNSRPQQ